MTIRHVKCHLIIQGEGYSSCAVCRFNKVNFYRKMQAIQHEKPQKFTKHVLLSKEELVKKVGQLQKEKAVKQRESSLRQLVTSVMERESFSKQH